MNKLPTPFINPFVNPPPTLYTPPPIVPYHMQEAAIRSNKETNDRLLRITGNFTQIKHNITNPNLFNRQCSTKDLSGGSHLERYIKNPNDEDLNHLLIYGPQPPRFGGIPWEIQKDLYLKYSPEKDKKRILVELLIAYLSRWGCDCWDELYKKVARPQDKEIVIMSYCDQKGLTKIGFEEALKMAIPEHKDLVMTRWKKAEREGRL